VSIDTIRVKMAMLIPLVYQKRMKPTGRFNPGSHDWAPELLNQAAAAYEVFLKGDKVRKAVE
jgi:hypothetical protein